MLKAFQSVSVLAGLLLLAAPVAGQAQTKANVAPTNDLPNPYSTIEGWAKLPEGRTWGSTSAVDIDKDGVSLWVAERCQANSCLNSNLDPIMKFDRNGKLLTSFGTGMLIFPHGIHVDSDGNIWVTDGQDNRPRAARGAAAGTPLPPAPEKLVGHNVYKFSPDGKLLLTLGKPGGSREPGEFFWQPNDVLVAPNGNVYVAEGHSSSATANARILVFDKSGKFLKEFGKKGTGPGEFDQPHALAMDSRGRLFVGDRSNNRIQILDQDGKFLEEWYQFSRPSGIHIDKNDVIYVADSESGSVNPPHGAWKRGIRIGSAKDGTITGFIPDPETDPRGKGFSTSSAEGVTVDASGVIYGAEVGQKAVKRYVKR
ncbi:MAG: peptidyl-alpha-hydroxyglycine alpha-amidating lyase family protein [Gemmatimonadota bacterium]